MHLFTCNYQKVPGFHTVAGTLSSSLHYFSIQEVIHSTSQFLCPQLRLLWSHQTRSIFDLGLMSLLGTNNGRNAFQYHNERRCLLNHNYGFPRSYICYFHYSYSVWYLSDFLTKEEYSLLSSGPWTLPTRLPTAFFPPLYLPYRFDYPQYVRLTDRVCGNSTSNVT